MAEASRQESEQCEGETVQLFRVRMQGVFRLIVESISLERFSEIFGEVIQGNKSLIKRLHKTWQDKVLKELFHEVDQWIAEDKIDEKFKTSTLDKCQKDKTTVAWRPPGNPQEHMRSLDIHEKLKMKKELEEFVNKKETAVQQLRTEVEAGQSYVSNLDTRLQTEIEKLKKLSVEEENAQMFIREKICSQIICGGDSMDGWMDGL